MSPHAHLPPGAALALAVVLGLTLWAALALMFALLLHAIGL
jgi:hypothetical protein